MLLFRILLVIDAIVALVLLYFFLQGISDGTVSAFNIQIWAVLLCGVAALIGGGLAVQRTGNRVLANILLAVLAIPAILFALLMAVILVSHPRWN
jgi:hypothetical protein